MHRTPGGKAVALTRRDLAIFSALADYRYLRSTYLHAFAGGKSETRFKERLGDLFHEGFIARPEKQWEFAHARHEPLVYEIDARARRALDEAGREKAPRTYLSAAAHRQFVHALMICEAVASIELAARTRSDLRFIPWAEILSRAPAETRCSPMPFRIPLGDAALVPDALFGLEYQSEGRKTYRFFALEADRSTMPVIRSDQKQSSFAAKLEAYRTIVAGNLAKKHWGISTLLVLTVTNHAPRMETMMCACSNLPAFLFKALPTAATFEARPMALLLVEPWYRSSLPPVHIDTG
jgi:hypothetical protein